MDDKIHQNQFYFVANAQLFDSSELNEISPMSKTAVNIADAFHIFIQIIGYANYTCKQLQFLLMNIANMNSETINC